MYLVLEVAVVNVTRVVNGVQFGAILSLAVTPTGATNNELLIMIGFWTVNVTGVGTPLAFVVESDTVNDTWMAAGVTCVGTPEINPLEELRESPEGRLDPALRENL